MDNEIPALTASATRSAPTLVLSRSVLDFPENATGTVLTARAPGATLTLAGPDAPRFVLGANGVLRFVAPPDYEVPADLDRDNVYRVTVRATAQGETATATAAITVADVVETLPQPGLSLSETAPRFSENGLGVVLTARGAPGANLGLIGPDAAAFVLIGGVLRFVEPPDFEAPADVDGNNRYDVTVTARNPETGTLDDAVAATVTVTDLSDGGVPPKAGVPGELIVGTDGNDSLPGTARDDTIGGGAGNDTLDAGGGDDRLSGSLGNDSILAGDGSDGIGGGPGADTISGGGDADTIGAGAGNDIADGGGGDDIVNGGPGMDRLLGGDGDDTSGASFGDDTVFGGTGDDSLGGGPGRDLLSGEDGGDAIGGGEGDDRIFGDAGDDFLAGGGRHDTIDGGAGNDTVNGSAGFDVMAGGTGADVFAFNDFASGDVDRITDFEDGLDRLRLVGVDNAPGSGLAGKLEALNPTDARVDGADSVLLVYEGHRIEVVGLSVATLDIGDVIFI
ncbi:Bifunctional hemolysin/adenylate cyclase precursor [Roseivivax jejudonensis]|uniref:Bifunctional hemolysin/adenylate cyclase n=1 Tax=Roseivivax jejudonensis TaxID=1529041 RepID=A0A1X6YDT0_9RHOB|nr:hypothetical protein [Roseivivax jejudonensis]SLN18291.1 Bifunctional hemolysin/adenylate cyclase precursor [Roseivivax jejudonensis]